MMLRLLQEQLHVAIPISRVTWSPIPTTPILSLPRVLYIANTLDNS